MMGQSHDAIYLGPRELNKTGKETPLQFGLGAKLVFRWGEGKWQIYLT